MRRRCRRVEGVRKNKEGVRVRGVGEGEEEGLVRAWSTPYN